MVVVRKASLADKAYDAIKSDVAIEADDAVKTIEDVEAN